MSTKETFETVLAEASKLSEHLGVDSHIMVISVWHDVNNFLATTISQGLDEIRSLEADNKRYEVVIHELEKKIDEIRVNELRPVEKHDALMTFCIHEIVRECESRKSVERIVFFLMNKNSINTMRVITDLDASEYSTPEESMKYVNDAVDVLTSNGVSLYTAQIITKKYLSLQKGG